MRPTRSLFSTLLVLLLTACVTINIYFPAAAAEEAADQVIDEVWGKQPSQEKTAPDDRSSNGFQLDNALGQLLELMIPVAQAAEPNIDVSTQAVQQIEASMRNRHRQLLAHYNSGAVGLTQDGLVRLRDPRAVPLKARKHANQLVAAENRDRIALYREIAQANGHPEWEQDIRKTFARRWIARAQSGWWYQSGDGSWKQK